MSDNETVLRLTLAKPTGDVYVNLYRDGTGSWYDDDGGEFVDSDAALLRRITNGDNDLSDLIADAIAWQP